MLLLAALVSLSTASVASSTYGGERVIRVSIDKESKPGEPRSALQPWEVRDVIKSLDYSVNYGSCYVNLRRLSYTPSTDENAPFYGIAKVNFSWYCSELADRTLKYLDGLGEFSVLSY